MMQSLLAQSIRRGGVVRQWMLMKPNPGCCNRWLADSNSGTVDVPIDEAERTTTKALRAIGWDEKSAKLQASVMVHAELCGNNQGLVKMYQPEMMAPAANAGTPIVERETPTSVVLNGNQAPGMVAANMLTDLVADKVVSGRLANTGPIAVGTCRNTSTSSGQLAYYVSKLAKEHNLIGIAVANSPEFVAAAPGAKGVFGTNPLAVAMPVAGREPFTFDMATSAIALFGVLSAKAKGEALPEGVAYRPDGQGWTTDAAAALEQGSIATFGGHKGMGLSLCVELLAGALANAAVLGQVESKKVAKSWGHVIVAIDHTQLVDDFPGKAASILRTVQASGELVRIPGDRALRSMKERQQAGVLSIPEKIWESVVRTAEHGLPGGEK